MRTLIALAACALGGVAWGADVVVERAPATVPAEGSPAYDGTLELKWDNGIAAWLNAWYTGAGTWFGNDFNISTVSSSRAVQSMRVFSGPAWPNGRWDGFRLGIYSFTSVPGSLLWGPKYVAGTSSNYGWNNFVVNWTLPASNTATAASARAHSQSSSATSAADACAARGSGPATAVGAGSGALRRTAVAPARRSGAGSGHGGGRGPGGRRRGAAARARVRPSAGPRRATSARR